MKKNLKIDYSNILFATYTEEISGWEIIDPNDEWSSRKTKYINKNYISVHSCDDIEDLPWHTDTIDNITFKPKLDDEVYLVVVKYSSGDTFGSTSGYTYIESAHKDEQQAHLVANSIRDNTYKGEYKPWEGYFSDLESVEVHGFKIKKYNKYGTLYHF